MKKTIPDEVWVFDCEWVPDINSGRAVYNLPENMPSQEVLQVMWEQGGATAENPMPFLKTILCRVVSIAAVVRRFKNNKVELLLHYLPDQPENPDQDEHYILSRFLNNGVANKNPQLVGFNSRNSDLRIMVQRAIVNGISAPALCQRLNAKPWESLDVDLMDQLSGFGRQYAVSLHEAATLCGIPGKLDLSGEDVCGLWYRGEVRRIIEYNCYDALTTYLLWLRLAFFSGKFTPDEYTAEQQVLKTMLEIEIQKPERSFLNQYIEAWHTLDKAWHKTHPGRGEVISNR